MKIFLAQVYCLFPFVYYCEKYHTNKNISDANLLLVLFLIFVKSIIGLKIFLGKIYCLFHFVYYCKICHKNKKISCGNSLLVRFCLLSWKVSYEWKYFLRKFIACSILLVIVKSIIRMKIFLVQIYCLFFFVYHCKKYHTNENISSPNLLLLFFCLLL